MRKISVALFVAATAAHAGTFAVGDVAVVEDTSGTIHDNVDIDNMSFGLMAAGGRFCRDTAKMVIPQFGDTFDGLFTFTPKQLDDLMNVQQGQPVRWSEQGIGEQPFDWGSQFGSAAKLSQCVFMGSLPKLPAQPDGPATALFGLPLGITGAELMGHEYGHHWMTWIHYDKNDGRGLQDMLRGYEANQNDPNAAGTLNGHYGYHVNSHSVMYGNFITDNGNGTFSLTGGQRKYGELDQYLMGLRAPSEVSPIMVLDDGSHHSSAAGAHGPSGTDTVTGMTRVDVSITDVIRAEGARVPAYPNAQSCWRVAFVLVVPPGQTYQAADVAKVEAYRQRWQQWFSWATDGRGTMDARLSGNGCAQQPPGDGGTVIPPPRDAGTPEGSDGGVPPAGEVPYLTVALDETPVVPVSEPGKIPSKEDTRTDLGIAKLRPGCGCGAGGAELAVLLGGLAMLIRRRRSS